MPVNICDCDTRFPHRIDFYVRNTEKKLLQYHNERKFVENIKN